MNIFKEIINLYKDYLQKEKVMAKCYEEITEKMEDGILLADQIVDVLKENKKLKEHNEESKEIIENMLKEFERMDVLCNYQLRTQAEQFLKEIGK